MRLRVAIVCGFLLLLDTSLCFPVRAQDNYENQVYGYETVEPHHTMVELHSNFTFQGSKTFQDGLLPTNHQLHETIEITHGFNDWFETGFYIFTSAQNGQGWRSEERRVVIESRTVGKSKEYEQNQNELQ